MTLTDSDLDAILISMDKYEDCTSLKDSLREVIAELRRVKLEAIARAYDSDRTHQLVVDDLKLYHIDEMNKFQHRHAVIVDMLQEQLDKAMKVIAGRMIYRPKP